MLSKIFEAKIIDFDLVHVFDDLKDSLTKGIGTFAYMSPEMLNEEDYNEKTDVYSFGAVLFALFNENLPKQSLQYKMNGKEMEFPQSSSSMSNYCIDLIKKCLSFDPKKRPSFEDILTDMKENSFFLADEVDVEIVDRRFRALNRFQKLNG